MLVLNVQREMHIINKDVILNIKEITQRKWVESQVFFKRDQPLLSGDIGNDTNAQLSDDNIMFIKSINALLTEENARLTEEKAQLTEENKKITGNYEMAMEQIKSLNIELAELMDSKDKLNGKLQSLQRIIPRLNMETS